MYITTNNKPRFLVDAYELTDTERKQFDYLDWEAIDQGRDSASFIRYKEQLYNLKDFSVIRNPTITDLAAQRLTVQDFVMPPFWGWDGFIYESYSSGILLKYVDCERVVIGRF